MFELLMTVVVLYIALHVSAWLLSGALRQTLTSIWTWITDMFEAIYD